jgi:hypothetical protein
MPIPALDSRLRGTRAAGRLDSMKKPLGSELPRGECFMSASRVSAHTGPMQSAA